MTGTQNEPASLKTLLLLRKCTCCLFQVDLLVAQAQKCQRPMVHAVWAGRLSRTLLPCHTCLSNAEQFFGMRGDLLWPLSAAWRQRVKYRQECLTTYFELRYPVD